jgi:hypothetical protein
MTSGRAVKRLFGKIVVALLTMLLCSASLAAPVSAVTAANDTYTTNEDIAVNCTVLTNDTGTGLVVDSVGTPAHGTASIVSGGGSITYTPNANWNGTDSFTYTVLQSANPYYSDHYYEFVSVPGGITWSAAQTAAAGKQLYGLQGYLVTITSAGEQNFVNTKLNGTTAWMGASDVSLEGAWRWVTGPEAGTQFCTETGGGGYSNSTGGYTAFGSCYNNWNAGEPNNYSGDEDYGQFLGGDTGLWNDLSSTNTVPGYVVEYGGMAGDPAAPTEVLTATVTVTVNAVNDAPVITGGDSTSVTMSEDGSPTPFSLTLNATDVDGDTLTWSVLTPASHGTATASGTGASKSIGYTATANYNGSDSFVVQVSDGALTDTIRVDVTVNAVNDAPIITEGDSTPVTMSEDGSPTPFSLTLNATDIESDTITWSISTAASHGTATATGTGASKAIGYSPTANYNGADSFVVRVSDGFGGTDDITVNVTVDAVNDYPVITEGDSIPVTMSEDGSPTPFSLTLNATDVDLDPLTWSVQTAAVHGTATATGTGASKAIGYSPAANYNGADSFVVRVSDGFGGTDDITVNVTVIWVNDVPSFTKGADEIVQEDCGAQTVNSWATSISAGPVDEAGQTLDFIVSNDNNALFSVRPAVSSTGVLTYTPAADAHGSATVSLTLTDDATRGGAALTTAAQTFTITITPVNEAGNRVEPHLTITLDTHAPVVVLSKPLIKMISGTTLNVEGSITDDLSGVRSLTIDGIKVIPSRDGTFTASIPLKRGLNIIAVKTLDNAGNRGSFTWTLDLTSVQQPHVGRRIDLTIDKKVMVVDGANVTMDVAPVILQSRTFLPLRALAEELGGSITWNAATRQVTVTARGVTIVLTIGKNVAVVNGKSILIDPANSKVVPIILGSRTFLPVRFIAEQLGLGVAWDAPTQMVTITWEP